MRILIVESSGKIHIFSPATDVCVVLSLNDEDKHNITHMTEDATVYASWDSGEFEEWEIEKILNWWKELNVRIEGKVKDTMSWVKKTLSLLSPRFEVIDEEVPDKITSI